MLSRFKVLPPQVGDETFACSFPELVSFIRLAVGIEDELVPASKIRTVKTAEWSKKIEPLGPATISGATREPS